MKFPHLTFYVEELPDGVAGRANGPIIRILRSRKKDLGLHAHEYEHVRQWYMTLFLHPLLYHFSRRYRLWSEARAFAEQAYATDNLPQLARRMASPHYDLGITYSRAREEILRHM